MIKMVDTSKIRMNLAAIKKVDPYAKEIVDSSSHVAFYTFNSESNEWEKTDVEGAFFVYSRNAEPYHSIFINNRLNTNSFVEPITFQLELQLQSPFLLYRNERSRIRGFWFYNSQECERIGNLVSGLIQKLDHHNVNDVKEASKEQHINIFNMLSKAQQEFNNTKTEIRPLEDDATCSVVKFFAAAKPTASEDPLHQKIMQTTLSVNQIEKQQIDKTHTDLSATMNFIRLNSENNDGNAFSPIENSNPISLLVNTKLKSSIENAYDIPQPLDVDIFPQTKPTLMPPNMFVRSRDTDATTTSTTKILNKTQLVQAFTYLIQNDSEFVQKLHEAYLNHIQ